MPRRGSRSGPKLRRRPRAEFEGPFYGHVPPAPKPLAPVAAKAKARFGLVPRVRFGSRLVTEANHSARAEFNPPSQPVYLGYNSYLGTGSS